MLPTFCPPTIWTISLEFHRKPSILAADDFLGACYRKAMTPKKQWTLLFGKHPKWKISPPKRDWRPPICSFCIEFRRNPSAVCPPLIWRLNLSWWRFYLPLGTKFCQRPHLVGTLLGFKMSKSRGREEQLRQKKAERRKKKKLGNMKNPHKFVVFFFWQFFTIKLGKMQLLDKRYPPGGAPPKTITYFGWIQEGFTGVFL